MKFVIIYLIHTNNLELLHEINPYYLMLVQEHFDFVVQDYVVVQLIDFFLLLFVQFVVQETSKYKKSNLYQINNSIQTSYLVIKFTYSALIFVYFICIVVKSLLDLLNSNLTSSNCCFKF
jgi:hypothetical protein